MILAIDPSLTGTAVVRGDENGFEVRRFASKPRTQSVYHRITRCTGIIEQIGQFIGAHVIEAVFIEGYSFGSNMASARYCAEFGGLLRCMLLSLTSDVYEVAPHALKKFASGVGKGGKEGVIEAVKTRYGRSFATDDECDAFMLYQIGLCVLGRKGPIGLAQAEVIAAILHPAPKKKKRRKAKKRTAKESRLF